MTLDDVLYEDIVFAQGEDADEPLKILDEKGMEAAIDYLAQWHDPGKHMTRNEPGAGSEDSVYQRENYILTWNWRLGYIGLEYRVSAKSDSSGGNAEL